MGGPLQGVPPLKLFSTDLKETFCGFANRIRPRKAMQLGSKCCETSLLHFSPLKRAYLCSMSFYLIGTAFPGFLSPLVLYAFDLFVLFLHLTFEQNSVICPPQGSLQRFFRGGGLSPPK